MIVHVLVLRKLVHEAHVLNDIQESCFILD